MKAFSFLIDLLFLNESLPMFQKLAITLALYKLNAIILIEQFIDSSEFL